MSYSLGTRFVGGLLASVPFGFLAESVLLLLIFFGV